MIKNVYWSHVNYRLFLSDFNETWIFLYRLSTKYPKIKFHENPSSGTRVVVCGESDEGIDRQTDTTKVTVAFRNFAKAPKNDSTNWSSTPKTRVHTETPTSTEFRTNRRLGRNRTTINRNSIYIHSILLVSLIRVGAYSVRHSESGLWSAFQLWCSFWNSYLNIYIDYMDMTKRNIMRVICDGLLDDYTSVN